MDMKQELYWMDHRNYFHRDEEGLYWDKDTPSRVINSYLAWAKNQSVNIIIRPDMELGFPVDDEGKINYCYPVDCPLMGEKIDRGTCFDIHMVVEGNTPKWVSPEEIYEYIDYEIICNTCRFHRD